MQPIPEDAMDQESEDEDKVNSDERISIRASEKRVACDEEFSDSEDEGDGGRRDNRSHRPKKHRKGGNSALQGSGNSGGNNAPPAPAPEDDAKVAPGEAKSATAEGQAVKKDVDDKEDKKMDTTTTEKDAKP